LLLIAGGLLDPNLQALTEAADALGAPWLDGRVPAGSSPPFHWDLSLGERAPLPWGGNQVPTGAFVRHDVFAAMADTRPAVSQRALGWSTCWQGWLLAHPQVRVFNADMSVVAHNKPAALMRARACGLRTPDTWVSNDVALLKARLDQPAIAKPVAGGGYCHTLEEAVADVHAAYSAMPALIQPRLVAPELRVFVVGQQPMAFEVSSPSLDYRALQDAEVEPVPVPEPEAQALLALMRELRMDFGAADFKTDPATGALVFLELNTSPMFARFDAACGGVLAACMVQHLLGVSPVIAQSPVGVNAQ
jgi:glutathione synthase/RimK-type ligase-like ATP-grasp enzyme